MRPDFISQPVVRNEFQSLYFRSGVISTTSLCIASGKAAWVLYVDATCINYDGNAFDATLIAMVAALQNSTYAHVLKYTAY